MELNSYVSSIRSSSRIIGYAGLYYSSPLLSSAIGNLNPAFTFMLALIFRFWLVIYFIVVQTRILHKYSDGLTVIFIYNTLVSIIGAAVTLIIEGTSSPVWILSSNTALTSVFSAGVIGSCLCNAADAWVLPVKGPVFVAMFTPFSMVIAVAMGVMMLGDTLHIGSLIGATAITIGFYMLMWGKVKEQNWEDATVQPNDSSSSSTSDKIPLLLQSTSGN
ncbi:WAT1-related protein At3g28050 [Linum perenne]